MRTAVYVVTQSVDHERSPALNSFWPVGRRQSLKVNLPVGADEVWCPLFVFAGFGGRLARFFRFNSGKHPLCSNTACRI